MKTKKIIFFMDAVRPDYINHKTMPFVDGLKQKHQFLKMKTQLGYSPGAHATIWSGLHQDRHDKFLIFYYDPKTSPFKWAKWLKLIPSEFLRKFLISALKVPYYKIRSLNRNPPKWYNKLIQLPPALPPTIAPMISTGNIIPKHKFTLFSILEDNNFNWFSQTDYHAAYLTKSPPKPLKSFFLSNAEFDFYYMYYADGLGHVKGVHSHELKAYLLEADNTIKRLLNEAYKKYDNVKFFIFSDHGMCEIKYHINIQKYLKDIPIKQPKDYISFYDATMARYWVFNVRARKILEQKLKEIPHTKFLDKNLLKKYHLEFKDRKWGDLMVVVDPHYRPFPDYFAPIKFTIKAYHGYMPEAECSKGIFLTNTFNTSKNEIDIVDIFPTILKAIGLEKQIPKDIDGKPIF